MATANENLNTTSLQISGNSEEPRPKRRAAESTSRGAGDARKAAQELVGASTELRRLVAQFKVAFQ